MAAQEGKRLDPELLKKAKAAAAKPRTFDERMANMDAYYQTRSFDREMDLAEAFRLTDAEPDE